MIRIVDCECVGFLGLRIPVRGLILLQIIRSVAQALDHELSIQGILIGCGVVGDHGHVLSCEPGVAVVCNGIRDFAPCIFGRCNRSRAVAAAFRNVAEIKVNRAGVDSVIVLRHQQPFGAGQFLVAVYAADLVPTNAVHLGERHIAIAAERAAGQACRVVGESDKSLVFGVLLCLFGDASGLQAITMIDLPARRQHDIMRVCATAMRSRHLVDIQSIIGVPTSISVFEAIGLLCGLPIVVPGYLVPGEPLHG